MSTPRPKLFRDPVHDVIAWRKDDPCEKAILRLIDTPEMQRLRRIRQLGLTSFVYHGAEHSRFVHSMGVTAFARRMYDQLRPIGPWEQRLLVLASALCHDLGHGPFSHVTERITGLHHERVTEALLASPECGVHRVLASIDPQLPERVAAFAHGQGGGPLRHIVASQLDADRFDYILRDGHATGVKIGVFDVERILSMLEEHDGTLAVSHRAIEAVEGYLLARFHMYKQVYLHKATRAAERMLEAAMRRARVLALDGATGAWMPDGPLGRIVLGELSDPTDVARVDDTDVWHALRRWTEARDAELAELADGLVNRRLFKTVLLEDGESGETLLAEVRHAAAARGLDPETMVLIDSSEDTPYKPYVPGAAAEDDAIRLALQDGRIVPIEAISDVVRLLGQLRYSVRRLVAPARVLEQAARRQPALL